MLRPPVLALLVSVAAVVAPAAAPAAAPQLGTELAPQQSLVRSAPGGVAPRAASAEPPLTATPRARCGPGSRPAPGIQGRVVGGETSADGHTCNTELVGREGQAGGYKVERFIDGAGRECAYYDTTTLFPLQASQNKHAPSGVAVLDMTDPSRPVRTATLTTPAMLTPHESMLVNQRRGLLAAVMATPTLAPGFIDIYDLKEDCRRPRLLSSVPAGLLGHESGWTPDGNTFYATSLFTNTVTAVDVSNPRVPVTLWVGEYPSHGFTTSADGNRGYVAGLDGLQILDISEIQARRPDPQVRQVAALDWEGRTIPQVALPVTIGGRAHLVEVDEFSTEGDGSVMPVGHGPAVGAARIIDISDERHPQVVSNMRLEVHQPEHRAAIAADPGARVPVQGYAAHYCNVPVATDPEIVACSMINSGLRIFDIRDPRAPREIAYYVAPPAPTPVSGERTNFAMSRPSFVPERGEIWYSDGNSGFYAVRVTNGRWPFAGRGRVRCASKRVFTIHLKNPYRDYPRWARVTVDGRPARVIRGRRKWRARIDLRGKPRKTVVVRVVGRTRSGKALRETRRYRTCRPGPEG